MAAWVWADVATGTAGAATLVRPAHDGAATASRSAASRPSMTNLCLMACRVLLCIKERGPVVAQPHPTSAQYINSVKKASYHMQIACRCNRALLLCHRGSASSVHAVYQHRPSRIPRQDGRGTSFASHAISEDSNGDAYWSRESTDVETAGSTEEDVTVVLDEVVLLTPEPAIDTA